MSVAVRRRNRKVAEHSNYLNIPHPIKAGDESTIVSDRILLADPRGEIPKDDLLEFLEKIEPLFWDWWREKQEKRG